MKKILLTILAVLAMSGMAMAQTETLLTTITATAKEQASYSTANVATVSFSYTAGGSSAYLANWGWWGYGWSATVTAAEGYTITKCIFYDDANRTATDSEAPFVVETTEEDKTPRINGTPIDGGNMWSKGIKKIEVYGYVAQTAPADVNLHRNDDGSWSFIMPGRNLVMSTETFSTNDTVNGHYLAGVPEGWLILALGDTVPVSNDSLRRTTPITEGAPVTIVPTGNLRRIKSITLVDEFIPVESITLNKTATSIKVGATETLSVTAVAPDNATDKTYTWKTSDASKATVDQDGKVTAVAAGTVTIYAEANDGSGVKGNCTVTVTPATITVTWNNDDITTGTGYGTSFTKDGVTITAGFIDFHDKNFMEGGTFTTTLGNFTKIEVTTGYCGASGTGWSGGTWTGNASSVSFSGDFMGMGMGNTKLVFTIEPTN